MKIGMAYFEFGGTKGVARATAELTRRIAQRGHQVDFHCVQHHGDSSGIRFKHVAALNAFSALGIASFAVMGKRSLQRQQYDITHAHGNVIGADIITAHSCHRAGLHAHHSKNLGVADKLRLFLERKNYGERRFKKIIAVAEGVKRELMAEYGVAADDVVVIPNGVDLDRFNPRQRATAGNDIRRKLGVRAEHVILLFVANEFERKGLSVLLSAMPLLRNASVHLVVLGGDTEAPYVHKARTLAVSENIHFCGVVGNIEDYYAAADVFVLPTYYEAFSLATLEAAALGLPLIVTKVNGTEELIEDGVNGFFIERDADDIARKVRLVADDPQLRSKLGTHARQSAERYAWEIIAEKTIALYEEVLR
jgi:UDP-glucose:(heptosyl)LPS alpha-1,3-glucosyltransferase